MNYLTYFNEINILIPLGTWISIGDLDINFGILLDSLSMVVIVPVGIVTLLVLFYAIDYMKDDPNRNRFLMILSVFAIFMTILVVSENYLMMFIGWEFVGIISYLLISFWSTRIAANKNALSAVLLNRMGDTFFVICLGTMITVFHALDFDTISLMTPHVDTYILNILALLLLLASTAKSAQLGLHAWLLGAMEGPTPVSSLLHAATMVCSGVFVLVRSSFILEYTPSILLTILWLGGITTLISGLIAITSNDIKRVIALSTMSQLAREKINNLFSLLKRKYIYIIYIFRNQTICEKVIYNIINSQITKARNIIYSFSIYLFNSFFLYGQYINLYNLLSVKWKIFIKSKLVGISEAIRLIFIEIYSNLFLYSNYLDLLIYNNSLSIINKMDSNPPFDNVEGEGHNQIIFFKSYNQKDIDDIIEEEYKEIEKEFKEIGNEDNISTDPFHEWLAGVIDGDGYFHLANSGTARLTISMDIRDKALLYEIKHKFGGSIYEVANANALRYKLSHKKGLINMINAINGNIRNPKRMLQMNKLCVKYNINLFYPKPLTFYNGWYSGLIDSDGSIYFNVKSGQVFISISQKDKYILEPLVNIFGGSIRTIGTKKIDAFRHQVYRKNELINLIDNYFYLYPLRSEKNKRLLLIKDFYLLRIDRESKDIIKLNRWLEFKNKWDKFEE
jgi:hypothetical protein